MIYTENYMNQKTVFGTQSSVVGWGEICLGMLSEKQRAQRILGHFISDDDKTPKKKQFWVDMRMGGLLFETPFLLSFWKTICNPFW